MKVRFFDIEWDTTDDLHPEGQTVDLPTEVLANVDDDTDLEEEGAGILSDRFGFCVNHCKHEIVR